MQGAFPAVMLVFREIMDVKIEWIELNDFSPFVGFHLPFNPNLTVVAGPNGVGKSRLLEAIRLALTGPGYGGWPTRVRMSSYEEPADTSPVVMKLVDNENVERPPLISFSASRDIEYSGVRGLRRLSDLYVPDNTSPQFKDWFVQVEYQLSRKRELGYFSRYNFMTAQNIFNILDPNVSFKEVNSENDILVNTPNGPLEFEKLSAGFRSAFRIMFEILHAIEWQSQGMAPLETYGGIVLVDEIDMHLHPVWQGDILKHLRLLIPRAQIIVTTHSAHVIQGLTQDELVVLATDSDGRPRQREIRPSPGAFGFRGWTVEEILQDVMGLESTVSSTLREVEEGFNIALDHKI